MPPFPLILFYSGRKVEINMRLRSVQMENVSDLVIVQDFACSFQYLTLVICSSVFIHPVLLPSWLLFPLCLFHSQVGSLHTKAYARNRSFFS